ncbi:hypothetical protein MLD38_022983 [Melastoma candidum]|uniref:Uncharacterized protein n=1 Tax=Melastoma candidum TaxID=119954 RepID=A0ACB9QPI5_9MYRT|nr:hypothetical protein MLD38_022983 [Melastoma candidum]
MSKHTFALVFLLTISSISHPIAQALTHGAISVDKLAIPNPTPEVTPLRFYMQVVDEGNKETSYRIANASITNQSPTGFGFLNMMDNLLTESPDPNSNLIGRAQGMIGSADLNMIGVYNNFNVYFTSGEYNGSTLNIVGRDPVFSAYREMSVVGGTKSFRLATGIVTLRDLSVDNATMDGVIEFNVTVIHPTTVLL